MNNFREKANLIWSIADLLRGHYKQADYGKVILPFTVLRRLDMVLEPTKKQVLEAYQKHKDKKPEVLEPILNGIAKGKFHNYSKYDFTELAKDHNNVAANLRNYIYGFSISAREIIDYFSFEDQIKKLDEYDLLYLVIKHFADAKDKFEVSEPMEMGYIFEELIRKFAEISNETAGEHFTPREVIRLMVNILFANDKDILRKEGIVKTLYDPACGTGGMLSVADEYLHELNSSARLELFGQELNPESYAICKSDMLIKGQNPANIKFGNSFSQDGLEDEKFDYLLSNPPFGVDWKKAQKFIKDEYDNKGYAGRFGAGLPSISDGSLLFLQHMISKMKQNNKEGSRLAIVFNGSPLFSGGAGSGPSEIRKWIIENDMLEAIIAMPDQLFYNTGIATYIWIITNRKEVKRKGKVQLINASGSSWEEGDKNNPFYVKMMRSLGNKRKEIGDAKNGKPDQIKTITEIYEAFGGAIPSGEESEYCKIFDNEDFGYTRITVERPKRNENGEIETDKKGEPVPDSDLRDYENIPLKEDVEEYFKGEVLPHLPDAWIDHNKTKIGYEINFTKYFYKYKPLRSLEEIRKDILKLEEETKDNLKLIIDN
ncbi:MAG: type I restriction-modification system subunit M [Bacteroidetes bacterium]|nr:type I restriction-modification system subunit M [Bacteroidota bacterium]MBU1681046.1 type I restriction-modification system subunit M [Bacteroidota bacterium]